jgi:hypothetical protein
MKRDLATAVGETKNCRQIKAASDTASWSTRLGPHVATALEGDSSKDAQALTDAIALSISSEPRPPAQFKVARFVGALVFFVVLASGGVAADVLNHPSSSAALFGFAGAVFGVVTAFLGAEKSASG